MAADCAFVSIIALMALLPVSGDGYRTWGAWYIGGCTHTPNRDRRRVVRIALKAPRSFRAPPDEPLIDNHMCSPLLATLLYGSTVASEYSLSAKTLANQLATALGHYALQIYLLHYPLRHYVGQVGGALQYVVLVIFAAALYTELVEKPLVSWLRRSL